MTVNELLEKRAGLIKDARDLQSKADTENRDMSAEEVEQFDRIMDEVGKLKDEADRRSKLEQAEAGLEVVETRGVTPEHTTSKPMSDEERDAENMAHYLRTGEVRAGAPWDTAAAAAGGYTAPTMTAKEVIDRMQNLTWMLSGSRQFPLPDAKGISIPKLTTEMTDAAVQADGSQISAGTGIDNASVFGEVSLTPYQFGVGGYVSNNLVHASGGLARDFMIQHISKKMAEKVEGQLVAGDGSTAPMGVFDETGALTTREVNGTHSTTDFDYDDLVDCLMNVTAVYRRNAAWLCHRDFVKKCMKLKDGEGNPIWVPSVVNGQPDRLLGFPVWESEYASNTFTADKRIAVFGDFSEGYGVAITLGLRILRLVEKYADYDATGFYAFMYVDGDVLDDYALSALHTKA